jgi:hypothetical protein
MSDNRYYLKRRHQKERHRQWLLDEEMRINEEIDALERGEKRRSQQRRQVTVVPQ